MYLTSHRSCNLLGSQMTPSRGWESQPLRSKKLQALLLLITGVRVWLGCVLESGCGCQPPFPADGTYLPLAVGPGRRSEADSTVSRAVYHACITLVSRVYYVCICLVLCAVVYYACINVYRCVSVCYHLPDTYYLGRPWRNTCITLYYSRITRVSTRINASSV